MDTMHDLDRIERSIDIAAPVERVWELVSTPGWWIGDGDRSGHTTTRDGDVTLMTDPRHGTFPVRVEASDPPRSIRFRSAEEGKPVDSGNDVEFTLTATADGTTLRVVESGILGLGLGPDELRAFHQDNVTGWEFQLDVARRDTEPA